MEEVPFVPSGNKTCGIDDLPPELLSEVVAHLDFKDILSLQQTSKKLRESAEARIVWLSLAEKYSAQHFHPYRPAIGPFDTLQTNELRAWIRKRLIVDEIWLAPHARPHIRTIDVRGLRTATLKLVPGARWLLMGCKDGSVRYYDLDSKRPEQDLLTPSSSINDGIYECVDDLEVHLDEDAPRLEFKLVIYRTDSDYYILPVVGRFHVWQVKLGDDGNSLVAEPLHTTNGHAFIDALALGRRLIACTMSEHTGSWAEIIWWEQYSTSSRRARFATGDGPIDKIHLLGDDKILCINRGGEVRLYTLPEPNCANGNPYFSSTRPEHLPSPKPIWSHSLSGGTYKCSSPACNNGTAYRLAVGVGDQIWGLMFSAGKDDEPLVIKLSDVPQRRDICIVGVCKAYTFHKEEGTGVRIGYSWDDVSTPTKRHFMGKRKNVALYGRYPVFDEEVGRFMYYASGNIVVVDYFPTFNTTDS